MPPPREQEERRTERGRYATFQRVLIRPIVTSHAAWTRQDGGLPVWGTYWYPTPAFHGMPAMERRVLVTAQVASRTSGEPGQTGPALTRTPGPTAVATVPAPTTGDGIYIVHNQQRWVRAGAPVAPSATFVRVGEYGDMGMFRLANDPSDMVFVRARPGGPMVPYRRKP